MRSDLELADAIEAEWYEHPRPKSLGTQWRPPDPTRPSVLTVFHFYQYINDKENHD